MSIILIVIPKNSTFPMHKYCFYIVADVFILFFIFKILAIHNPRRLVLSRCHAALIVRSLPYLLLMFTWSSATPLFPLYFYFIFDLKKEILYSLEIFAEFQVLTILNVLIGWIAPKCRKYYHFFLEIVSLLLVFKIIKKNLTLMYMCHKI